MDAPEILPVLTLYCHPTLPCPAVNSLHVGILRTDTRALHLQYTLRGDLSQLRIPALQTPATVDGLWEHTCFEVFIGVQGDNAYHEFNFSPSSQWAAYAFSAYRERRDWQAHHAPEISILMGNELQLDAIINADDLPTSITNLPLQLGLTAVIETIDGEKSYWALRHPATRPDFHHKDGFLHEIWP